MTYGTNDSNEFVSDGYYGTSLGARGDNQTFNDRSINAECYLCHEYFTSESPLKEHMSSMHGKDYVRFCPICDRCFFSPFGYSQHISLVHSAQKSGPQCSECGMFFTHKSRLLNHMKKHSKEKNFTCLSCEKSFKFKHSLKTHSCKS